MLIRDIIAPGFGPSNIALAIAADERRQASGRMNTPAIQRQPGLARHENMLHQAHMQIALSKGRIFIAQAPEAARCCVNSAIPIG